MRGHYQILIPLLSLFLVRVDLTDLFPLKYPVQVLEILDGDTLLLGINQRRIKLRLSRIDAPEKGQPFLSGKGDAGLESTKCLKKELSRISSPVLEITGHDIYRRTLGDLSDLSFRLVQNGCTALYPHAVFQSQNEKARYQRALSQAKSQRRGLWKEGGFLTPKIWRKTKKKTHRSGS